MTTQPSMALAKKPQEDIGHVILAKRGQLLSLLPKGMTPERFMRVALNSIAKNPKLAACSQRSIIAGLLQAASVGLEVDNGLGHAYLVPYGTEAQLILGYKGLVQLMWATGMVAGMDARVVREGDLFEYSFGLNPVLTHKPIAQDKAAITHIFAVIYPKDRGDIPLFEVRTKAQVDEIRERSRAGKSGPWVTDYEEMARKTVLRRLAKLAPMLPMATRIVQLDELAENGLDQTEAFDPDLVLEGEGSPAQ